MASFCPFVGRSIFSSSIGFFSSSSAHFLHAFFCVSLLLLCLPHPNSSIKCLDCVGSNCMGSTCEGDYCLISHYAPRWGTMVWGEPAVVKGCLSGRMIRGDVRSHCEVGDDRDEDPFTCFCDGKDFCNGKKLEVEKLEVEPVPFYSCVCEGPHCRGKICIGELCTFVLNHRSGTSEQGCVNASVPLVERRSAGACMMPPITGSMHHTVAKTADDLLHTESCVCEGNYCNSPKPIAPERSKCRAFVHVEVMGQKMSSKNLTCTGEFCFRAEISSQLGSMSKYRTMGCATFMEDAQLAEELEPVGCAKFISEKLQVEACFQTKDRAAIARARESRLRKKKPRTKGRTRSSEVEEEEGEIEDWDAGSDNDKAEEGPNEKGSKEAEEEEEEEEEEKEKEGKAKSPGTEIEEEQIYIFERPTLAPELEESTNSTLIAVFVLLILLILLSGVVWKFQLHKRLFRASYDTVAGG